MIRVSVEGYCQDCLDFTPDVTKPERLVDDAGTTHHQTDTIVQCKYRKRCSNTVRYLERQIKGENDERKA